MAISLTVFKNIWDNQTSKRMDLSGWAQFESLLYRLAERPLGGKKDAELISPATYVPNTTRANKNVVDWGGWTAVDVDDHQFEGNVKDELYNIIGHWNYIVYSTASSTVSQPKFRIVFETGKRVPADKIRHFWFALQSVLDDQGDKQCKDLSRMYYTPATYLNANNFIFSNRGDAIDVDRLLLDYPYVEKKNSNNFMDRLPESIQRSVIEHRKSKMENTQYIWSGYTDCPFWPRNLADEYRSISGTGWYHKMYQIMVAVAARAISKEYPITASQIADLCKEFDRENGNWYENRPLEVEADRALEYAYKNV